MTIDKHNRSSIITISRDSATLMLELYEHGQHYETVDYPGKSIHYVRAAARNWQAGILTKQTITHQGKTINEQ